MTPINPRNLLGAAAGALACVLFSPTLRADQSYNTLGDWDQTTQITPFGVGLNAVLTAQFPPPPVYNTPTYGETFIAPTGDTVLDDFTFVIGSTDGVEDQNSGNFLPDANGDVYTATAEVYNWTGSLFGGNGPQGTMGPALFSSSISFTLNGSYVNETVNTGGVQLTAGSSYVIDLTDVTSPSNGDFGIWALDEYSNWANDGGGDFAFSDNGSVGTWDDSADFGDLAFKADFSASASNGVPDVAGTAILFALGLASLTLLGRRQAALVRV